MARWTATKSWAYEAARLARNIDGITSAMFEATAKGCSVEDEADYLANLALFLTELEKHQAAMPKRVKALVNESHTANRTI